MAQIKSLDDLLPDTRNANRGTKRGREMVARSLKDYGAGRSILVDRKGQIIAGNKTAENAGVAGLKDVIVVPSDGTKLVVVQRTDLDLKDPKARELAIADNRSSELNLDWDAEVLGSMSGEMDLRKFWDASELGVLCPTLVGPDESDEDQGTHESKSAEKWGADDLMAKWKTASGQTWQVGGHRLMCGDATAPDAIASLMQAERAACVFTSPPYAVGIDYGQYVDTIENLRDMLPRLAGTWRQILEPGGFAIINFGDIVSASDILKTKEPCEYPMALEYWPVFRGAGYTLWSRRIWCKPAAGTGSMQCISSNRASTNWEHVWTWKAPGKSKFKSQTVGDYPSQNGWIDSTHEHQLAVGLDVHAAGMPVAVPTYFLSTHSEHGDVVHEPFSGTGTTMAAAEMLGRKCYAMEIEPKYVAVALERMSAMGLKPKLVS